MLLIESIWVQINYTGGFLSTFYLTTQYFSTALLVIIIYNTKFSDSFIKGVILIFKITAILAVTASIIQIFHPHFLNAFQYITQIKASVLLDNLYQIDVWQYLVLLI